MYVVNIFNSINFRSERCNLFHLRRGVFGKIPAINDILHRFFLRGKLNLECCWISEQEHIYENENRIEVRNKMES